MTVSFARTQSLLDDAQANVAARHLDLYKARMGSGFFDALTRYNEARERWLAALRLHYNSDIDVDKLERELGIVS